MAEKTTSNNASGNSGAPGATAPETNAWGIPFPFTFPFQVQMPNVSKMFEDPYQRMKAFNEEMTRIEQKSAEQARAAIDEMARLSKESIAYSTKMSGEWRNLWLETNKRLAEVMKPVSGS